MNGFRFGIEAEFCLMRVSDRAPLWHQDVNFDQLNEIFESIPLEGIPDLAGLELEKPARRLMPFVVEGYHMPNQDGEAQDIKVKGVEIRTPVCSDLEEMLDVYGDLFERLRTALAARGMAVVALSHHPIATHFEGPQNKRRHDFWQWAMEVMTTFGPDINVGVSEKMWKAIDFRDLEAKIDHYGPALAALSVAAPFLGGDVWKIRGQAGKSFRMYKRSVIAPPIEIHPRENFRLEFKVFDMPTSRRLRAQFLAFLALILTPGLEGRSSKQTRVYDLGQIARFGLEAEGVRERLTEIFEKAPAHLRASGFDPAGLGVFRERLLSGVPADDLLDLYESSGRDLGAVLEHRSRYDGAR